MKSIQSKILTVIISSILILTVLISIVSVIYVNKILTEDSDIITESVSEREALRLDETLATVEASVKILESYVMVSLDSAESLTDESFRDAYTEQMRDMFSNVATNTSGVVAFYLRYNPELAPPTSGFFISSNAGGKELVDFEPVSLENWQNEPFEKVGWYSAPVTAGEAVWTKPYLNQNNNIKMMSYVIPFYKNHTLCGVVGMDIEFKTVTDMVSEISVYDNGFAYLADAEDNIYFSPVDDHKLDEAHRDHGFAEEHIELRSGMYLIIHADYSDIQRDSYGMVSVIVLITLCTGTLFIVITFLLTRKIVKPLQKLTESAERLADGGKLELDAECNTNDEIGALARSFRKTSEKLSSYMTYINALAYRDSLTGVKNRTAYNEASIAMDKKMRTVDGLRFAVLVADINMLKKTNDGYGHDIGNQLIIRASKIICDTFKHSPVFRVGGDEFVVILENEDYLEREALIKEMDRRCAEDFVITPDGRMPVSIARGAADYDFETDSAFQAVFDRADREMYINKQAGRGCPVV